MPPYCPCRTLYGISYFHHESVDSVRRVIDSAVIAGADDDGDLVHCVIDSMGRHSIDDGVDVDDGHRCCVDYLVWCLMPCERYAGRQL